MISDKELKQYATQGHPPEIVKLVDKMLERKLDVINERLDRLWAAYVLVIKKQNNL